MGRRAAPRDAQAAPRRPAPFARALLPWFASSRRALPWRDAPPGARDAYRVWVSEVMLQQTRVETVLRYYARFLARFPDPRALAAAHEDELMKAWEGLGYYRRARLLQKGARHVVAHGMPRSFARWLEVPGVGPYTAGAIASLALGEAVPAVDGNVLRVWSRVRRSYDDITSAKTKAKAEEWVRAQQPPEAAGAFNEALMELGATVCAPTSPRCGACPVASACAGRDVAGALPVKARKAASPVVRVSLAIARRGGRLLLERRESGLLAGTWGLPYVEGGPAGLAARVGALTGGAARVGARVAVARRVFTHRVWEMEAFAVDARGAGGEWRDPGSVALATAHRKVLAKASAWASGGVRARAPSSPSPRPRP